MHSVTITDTKRKTHRTHIKRRPVALALAATLPGSVFAPKQYVSAGRPAGWTTRPEFNRKLTGRAQTGQSFGANKYPNVYRTDGYSQVYRKWRNAHAHAHADI